MKKISLNYQYNKKDKMFEFFTSCSDEYFWFYLGINLSKSKVTHLIHTCKDNSIQIFAYNFDTIFTKDFHYKDSESLAKKVVKLIEDFILTWQN
jgi:hypothetical protein